MHAQRVDVLHRADRDAGVVGVAHHLVLDLLPAHQALLDHHLADRAEAQAGADAFAIGGLGGHDAAAGATQREGRADDGRQPDALEGALDAQLPLHLGGALDDLRRRIGLTDAVEQVAEALPVLGHLDGLDGRAQQPHPVALEEPGTRHVHGQVQRRLPAQAGEDAVGPLRLEDALHRARPSAARGRWRRPRRDRS